MNTNKLISKIVLIALLAAPIAGMIPAAASAAAPNWSVAGSWSMDMHFNDTVNPHDITLTQDGSGNLGGGGSSGAYTWVIDSGTVSGNDVNFTAHYTATADATSPLTTLTVTSTINPVDGTMSGTWSDNYQGGSRTGDWTTISGNATALPGITTNSATGITTSDATLNGTNGNVAADGHSFWASPNPFVITDTNYVAAGAYSTADLGAVTANTSFSALLSSVVGMPSIVANHTYYFAAWSHVNGEWIHGDVLSFTTAALSSDATVTSSTYTVSALDGENNGTITNVGPGTSVVAFSGALTPAAGATFVVYESDATTLAPDPVVSGDIVKVTAQDTTTTANYTVTVSEGGVIAGTVGQGILHVDSITAVKTSATADGTFANGWEYTFHVTAPTNETNLAMKFADWVGANPAHILPVAGNMQISSAQASNGPITLTAANVYSAPLLINADLNPALAGNQVDITVKVAVPVGTAADSYTTTYGIQTTP